MKDAPLGEMASEEDFVWLLCIKALPLLSEEHLSPESGGGKGTRLAKYTFIRASGSS